MNAALGVADGIEHSWERLGTAVEKMDRIPRLRVVHNLLSSFWFCQHGRYRLSGPYTDRGSNRVDCIRLTGYTADDFVDGDRAWNFESLPRN